MFELVSNRESDRSSGLSPATPDRIYVFSGGALLTSSSMVRDIVRRREATVSIGLGRQPLGLVVRDRHESHQAFAIRQLVRHRAIFAGTPSVSVLVAPNHQRFRAFRLLPGTGLLPLNRAALTRFDCAFVAAYRGELDANNVHELFSDVVSFVVDQLPPPKPLDRRIEQVLALLAENTDRPLGDLAKAVHLSYYRLSHLFAENMGLPLRSYQLSRRLHSAFCLLADGLKQAEIAHRAGFADVSHLRRVCCDSYGVSPTFFRNPDVSLVRL